MGIKEAKKEYGKIVQMDIPLTNAAEK